MGWQTLVIIIGFTLIGLVLLSVLFWFVSRWSTRHRTRRLGTQLVEYLRSVGIDAERQNGRTTMKHTHEDDYAVVLRHLLTIRVWLRGIESIEIWQITRKGERKSSTQDEMIFVIVPEPGMSLNRIPILTNLVRADTAAGYSRLKWRGFEWGQLPLLVDRLRADTYLNSRLLEYLDTNLLDDLRITALSGNRIGITTSYNPRKLPSRGFFSCIEDIAGHILDHVAEQNRSRDSQNIKLSR